ncbi:MAG: LCP family protein [Aeriscardovia sp.]|nr:LCP family protein [Aeriscardovia sp.]
MTPDFSDDDNFVEPPSFAPSSGSRPGRPTGRPPKKSSADPYLHGAPLQAPRVVASGRKRRQKGRLPKGSSHVSPSSRLPRKRHHIFLAICTTLVSIIFLLAGAAGGLYLWIDHQIQHYQALTTMPKNGAEESWLITGVDQRDGAAGTGAAGSVPGFRTDTIMLLIKPKNGKDALISIPRDTLVYEDGYYMKINAIAETYGWPALAAKVEQLTGVKIDHAVRANFNTIEDVVNAMGGVYVCFNRTVDDPYSGFKWKAGCGVMNGETALAFARERHSDPLGDIGREQQQRILIKAMFNSAMKPSFYMNLRKVAKVIQIGLQNVKIDDTSHANTLLTMAEVFYEATHHGITGIPYISNLGYEVPGVGDCILWNNSETRQMFQNIINGKLPAGTVGGIQ